MTTIAGYELSAHAERRCQQRGISHDALYWVLAEADWVEQAPGGAERCRISDQRLCRRRPGEDWPPALTDEIRGVCPVVDGGRVITVFRPTRRRRCGHPRPRHGQRG